MDVSLHQMEAFSQVAQQRSFTRAAEELRLSQPAISRTIRDLEHQLGVRLLERTSRSVDLTLHGHEFLVIANNVLAAHAGGLARFATYLAGERGRVTVAVLPSFAAVGLPEIVAAFVAETPQVHVEIIDVMSADVLEYLRSGSADLGITTLDNPPRDFVVRPLLNDRFTALVKANGPLAGRGTLSWTEMAEHPIIVSTPGSSVRRITDQVFAQLRLQPNQIIEAGHVTTIGGLVAAGLGVSALPTQVLPQLMFSEVVSLPLVEPVVERGLSVMVHRERTLTPAAERFVAHLLSGRRDR